MISVFSILSLFNRFYREYFEEVKTNNETQMKIEESVQDFWIKKEILDHNYEENINKNEVEFSLFKKYNYIFFSKIKINISLIYKTIL